MRIAIFLALVGLAMAIYLVSVRRFVYLQSEKGVSREICCLNQQESGTYGLMFIRCLAGSSSVNEFVMHLGNGSARFCERA